MLPESSKKTKQWQMILRNSIYLQIVLKHEASANSGAEEVVIVNAGLSEALGWEKFFLNLNQRAKKKRILSMIKILD
jgi:hypothetical protein